jgi:hypothetical protein
MSVCPGKDFMQSYMPDAVPSLEEKKKNRALMAAQGREVLTGNVTCECGRCVSIHMAYKCFYCGVWLCRPCARKHFNVPDEWQGWYDFEVRHGGAS